jgi:hypothetical protein
MSITLPELLTLVGRLDDEPGFDTARERYRRFLLEHVTSIPIDRAFIEQCQHALDEQQHRALQDLVVLLGRFLGFETKFGYYGNGAGFTQCEGLWRSRARLDVYIDVRTAQIAGADVDHLSHRVMAAASDGSSTRPLGLCVTMPLYTNRGRLEETLATVSPQSVRIASLRSLIDLAEMVDARVLGHPDVVKLIESTNGIDFVVDLLQRVTPTSRTAAPARTQDREANPGFWLATVTGDPAIEPGQFLERVIGRRQIFGVSGTLDGAAGPGDWICFYIPEKGVVGRAQVGWIVTERTGLRDAHQYCQMFRLDKIDLHVNAPIAPDAEAQLRLRAARSTIGPAPSLLRINQRDFVALTTNEAERSMVEGSGVAANGAAGPAPDDALALSAGDLRSPA